MIREIVKINEELCDGCGLCIPNCHEGALQIIDGKARLISELMCDGLGACLGHCPQNAITLEKREAEDYNEEAVIEQMILKGKATVFAHLKHLQDHDENIYLSQALNYLKSNREKLSFSIKEVHDILHTQNKPSNVQHNTAGSCPGSSATSFHQAGIKIDSSHGERPSTLSHWPIQLHLINPAASYFQKADLLVAADCAGFAYGDFHRKFIAGKKMVIACPKLDNGKEIYINKIIRLVDEAEINSITVVIMEVPCCGGLAGLVKTALAHSERKIPLKLVIISTRGELLSEQWDF